MSQHWVIVLKLVLGLLMVWYSICFGICMFVCTPHVAVCVYVSLSFFYIQNIFIDIKQADCQSSLDIKQRISKVMRLGKKTSPVE